MVDGLGPFYAHLLPDTVIGPPGFLMIFIEHVRHCQPKHYFYAYVN